MRRRLPSPAVVIASIALFVVLGGAGFAASVAFVRSPRPIALVPGSVSADGKVTGAHLTGGRVSEGVYTLTISGDTFAASGKVAAVQSMVTPQAITIAGSNNVTDANCLTSGESVASNGSATVQVDCLTFDPATGWQPADSAFDVLISGPSR